MKAERSGTQVRAPLLIYTRCWDVLEAQEGDRFGRRDEGLGAIVVAGLERWHDPTRGGEWRAVEPNLAGEEVTRRGAASYKHPLVSWQPRSDESRGEVDCHLSLIHI